MGRFFEVVNAAAHHKTTTSFVKIHNIPSGIPRDDVIDIVQKLGAAVVWHEEYMYWYIPSSYAMRVELKGIILRKEYIEVAVKTLAGNYGLHIGKGKNRWPSMSDPKNTFDKPEPRAPSHFLRLVCFIQGVRSPGLAMRKEVGLLAGRWVGRAVSSETRLCPMKERSDGRFTVVLRLDRVDAVDRALVELDMGEYRLKTGQRVFIYPTQRGEEETWYVHCPVAHKSRPAATAYQAPPVASGIGMAQQAPPAGAVPPVTPLLASPPAVAPRVTPPPAAALGSAGASREEVEARRQAIREAKEFVESNLEYIA